MSAEKPNFESQKDNGQTHEVALGIPFKPYDKVCESYCPKKGEQPFIIPEEYSYGLLLRKEILFYGIKGYIDVITESPIAAVESLFSKFPLEDPLGDTGFIAIIKGRDKIESIDFIEQPHILRLSFLLKTPAEYAKLLNAYVDVKLRKEKYMLFWNMDKLLVRRNLMKLGDNEDVLVVEKNLYNVKWLEGSIPLNEEQSVDDGEKQQELGRTTFIWLQPKLKKLRQIDLTFRRVDDNGDSDTPKEPVEPKKELVFSTR